MHQFIYAQHGMREARKADAVDRIVRAIQDTSDLYYRLVLLVGPSGAGKTSTLYELASKNGFQYLNLSLEVSRRLLDLPTAQRPVAVRRFMDELMDGDAGPILCDNIELLFDVSLRQDPLHLLQLLSRKRAIVAAWNGSVAGGYLIYAAPDHPEYRRYPAQDLLLIALGETPTR
jgi:hypothetical protein